MAVRALSKVPNNKTLECAAAAASFVIHYSCFKMGMEIVPLLTEGHFV